MFDTITSSARPTAASQAAKTRMMIGIIKDSIEWEFSVIRDVMVNKDKIIPSKHSRVDIRWDRNIKAPSSDRINVRSKLKNTGVIWYSWLCP